MYEAVGGGGNDDIIRIDQEDASDGSKNRMISVGYVSRRFLDRRL
jgi:hypothetical protein